MYFSNCPARQTTSWDKFLSQPSLQEDCPEWPAGVTSCNASDDPMALMHLLVAQPSQLVARIASRRWWRLIVSVTH